ncbi:hypothetical protein LguiB_000684 [Lonicera macranthoides]
MSLTCFLQYSMNIAKTLPVTFGIGIHVSAQYHVPDGLRLRSHRRSSTSNISLSELSNTIIFGAVDIIYICWY